MLQHDVITTFCLIILIEKLVLRVNTAKQLDVTTLSYDNVPFDRLIEKLVLRVNTTKQRDVTTRRYFNVLFVRFD
jgi:hypothetical protein